MELHLRDVIINSYDAIMEGQEFTVGNTVTLGIGLSAATPYDGRQVPPGISEISTVDSIAHYRVSGRVIPVQNPIFETMRVVEIPGMSVVILLREPGPGEPATFEGTLQTVEGYVTDSLAEPLRAGLELNWRIDGIRPARFTKGAWTRGEKRRSAAGKDAVDISYFLLNLSGPSRAARRR